jgi:hypothetical protein
VNLVYLEAACADPLCELRGFLNSQAEYRLTVRAAVPAREVRFPKLRSENVYMELLPTIKQSSLTSDRKVPSIIPWRWLP